MSHMLAKPLLEAFARCKKGNITITLPDGHAHTFSGEIAGTNATWEIKDWAVITSMVARGDIGMGETYIDGLWDSDNVADFFTYCLTNLDDLSDFAHGSLLQRIGFQIYNYFLKRNSKKGSRENISAHYDVGNEFYQLWLDETMTYSSALRLSSADNLPTAQLQKYGRIAGKIGSTGAHILEIGCGWGGFAEVAVNAGHRVDGITLSQKQHDFAKQRLIAQSNSANISLTDYRKTTGKYDAIVSIEMFEAVGERYWQTYFNTIKSRLAAGGNALIQTITVQDEKFADYRKQSDYIRHYIFPGGMLPARGVFSAAAEKAGLAVKEVFEFGQDYAWTLEQWLARFTAQKQTIHRLGYDEPFMRSWVLYLAMCIGAFRVGRTNVMQVELVHA